MKPIHDADNNPIGKIAYLENQPRAFPETAPRLNSSNNWQRCAKLVQSLVFQMSDGGVDRLSNDRRFLRKLNEAVQQKDQNQYPNDATAIGSDHVCPGDQSELDKFTSAMLELFEYCKARKTEGLSSVVRILGYVSTNSSMFENWMMNNLYPSFSDGGAVKHSFGLCARDPDNIAAYLKHLFSERKGLPGTNDMKSVSQILRYRANATEQLSADVANEIFEKTTEIFKIEMGRGGSSFNFRWSGLVIVFLLRRRMFDADFADPDGRLAMQAKTLFERAILDCKSGGLRPLGGSVDVPAALRQMINYIDKKGRGDILMSSEQK